VISCAHTFRGENFCATLPDDIESLPDNLLGDTLKIRASQSNRLPVYFRIPKALRGAI
jgi:hypothetical protein